MWDRISSGASNVVLETPSPGPLTANNWTHLAMAYTRSGGVLAAFVMAGLVASTGEARRLIQGGGLRVNDEGVSDPRLILSRDQIRDGAIKLSMGKKKHVLIKVG